MIPPETLAAIAENGIAVILGLVLLETVFVGGLIIWGNSRGAKQTAALLEDAHHKRDTDTDQMAALITAIAEMVKVNKDLGENLTRQTDSIGALVKTSTSGRDNMIAKVAELTATVNKTQDMITAQSDSTGKAFTDLSNALKAVMDELAELRKGQKTHAEIAKRIEDIENDVAAIMDRLPKAE
jgi:uncharacterized protein Yka (UPF0111/DUF47 family)